MLPGSARGVRAPVEQTGAHPCRAPPPEATLTGEPMVGLGVIACLVFCFALVSGRLEGTPLTAPIVFVAAGLAAPMPRGWTATRCGATRCRCGCSGSGCR
jgi:hypothetical protein